jgi:hypothetical protein
MPVWKKKKTDYKTGAESRHFIVLDQYTQEWKVAESYQSESLFIPHSYKERKNKFALILVLETVEITILFG